MIVKTRRTLVVGMNPARVGARSSISLRRLNSWVDVLGLGIYSFVNVGSAPGERFEIDYELLAGCCEGHSKVIALGALASRTLARIDINHFRMPHPSGRNRLLNDAEYVESVLRECARYLED